MGKLVTGVSTDLEFRKAITDKGAELTANATPLSLAEAIDATGGNVSFLSPNEVVVESVNSEIPGPEIVPWTDGTVSDKIIFKSNVHFAEDDALNNEVIEELIGETTSMEASFKDESGDHTYGTIAFNGSSFSSSQLLFNLSYENSLLSAFYVPTKFSGAGDKIYDWNFHSGTYTVDGVEREISSEEINELLAKFCIESTGSLDDFNIWVYNFINTVSE